MLSMYLNNFQNFELERGIDQDKKSSKIQGCYNLHKIGLFLKLAIFLPVNETIETNTKQNNISISSPLLPFFWTIPTNLKEKYKFLLY